MSPRTAAFLTHPDIPLHDIFIRRGFLGRKIEIRRVILRGDLSFYSKILGRVVTVPGDFLSDGASVPKIFWNIFPPFGRYLEAAVIHDFFCRLGYYGYGPVDYKVSAAVFDEAMQVLGVHRFKRLIIRNAVLLGGPKFDRNESAHFDMDFKALGFLEFAA